MKFDVEKLKQVARPLTETERQQIEYQLENKDWLLMSVKLAMKIRSHMEELGINQSELARRMSVSPAQVTKILSGRENLCLKTIAKVEAVLGKSLLETDDSFDNHKYNINIRKEYNPLQISHRFLHNT